MTMIAVEYFALGEYSTSLQIAGHTLLQIPSEDKSTLESIAPKQVSSTKILINEGGGGGEGERIHS